ncbi:hypothetical protein F5Y17DRAFT_430276 [Xylariaceae sp. FL0594]|nr:hypothetical protein F5Y17DRAFT_430276 [Xylariaceae sp. FL0594]
MTTDASSPRRRHILSSINPEPRPISPRIETEHRGPVAPPSPLEGEQPRDAEERKRSASTEEPLPYPKKKTTKFRFKKSKHSSRSHRSSRHRDRDYNRDRDRDWDRSRSPRRGTEDLDHNRERERDHEHERDGDGERSSSRRRRHHSRHHHRRHHHHRHKRRHTRSRSRSRSATPPNPYEPPPLDPEAAFRESLFDAMADDEGAAYWEGVYGQPIHVYERPPHDGEGGGKGKLEMMDDDEYAAYVREKMWAKTHQGLLEERARRAKQKEEQQEKEREAERLTRQMEESLRRGEERRVKKAWKARWEHYSRAWNPWDGTLEGLAWPVRSGRREDVRKAGGGANEVRDFYVLGIDPVEVGESEFLAKLKDERVRWHPDKIQQRLTAGGGATVDADVMRDVTAVFQIVDKLWSDTRSKQTTR